MTKKELRKVEEVVEKVLHDMLEESYEADGIIDDDDETVIPMSIIDEIEEYMGESITFMGIS